MLQCVSDHFLDTRRYRAILEAQYIICQPYHQEFINFVALKRLHVATLFLYPLEIYLNIFRFLILPGGAERTTDMKWVISGLEANFIDAFRINQYDFIFRLLPPFPILARVLSKSEQDKAEHISVMSFLLTQDIQLC